MFKRNTLQESHLFALLKNAKKPGLRTIEVLVYRLFGRKRLAGQAFRRLLFWIPRSQRKDGAVFKSSKELSQKVGCVPKSIDRAIPILKELCFTVFLKKAHGAPTNHYILEEDRLVARLAEIFEASVEQIYQWMNRRQPQKKFESDRSKSPNPLAHNVRMEPQQDVQMDSAHDVRKDSDKMSETITRKTNNKKSSRKKQQRQNRRARKAARLASRDPQETVQQKPHELGAIMKGVTHLRDRIGCNTVMMCNLVTTYGVERIEYVVGKAEIEQRKGKIQNKTKWIVAALMKGYEWDDSKPEHDDYSDLIKS